VRPLLPIGYKLLVLFFAFGASMCALTAIMLLFQGTALDSLWRLNPDARASFETIGRLSILLFVIVGMACALAALGLARGARWGRWLAIGVLTINLTGDLGNAFFRHDLRTLIGLPISGAMIVYLRRRDVTRA